MLNLNLNGIVFESICKMENLFPLPSLFPAQTSLLPLFSFSFRGPNLLRWPVFLAQPISRATLTALAATRAPPVRGVSLPAPRSNSGPSPTRARRRAP